jgi:general secretion pathway protein K
MKSSDPGFILLTSIWLLVLGGAIAAAVMLNARSTARSIKAAEQQILAAQALLSARDQMIADLLQAGRFSRWAQAASSGSFMASDGIVINVQSSQEGGRLDLLSAQNDRLDRLFSALDLPDNIREPARARLDSLRKEAQSGKRPLRSLGELRALSGWTPELIACLLPLITLHSGMPSPSPSAAPAQLARILALTRNEEDASSIDSQSVAGELYRINATAQLQQTTLRSTWIVRITGDLRRPYWVLATFPGGLPNNAAADCFKA